MQVKRLLDEVVGHRRGLVEDGATCAVQNDLLVVSEQFKPERLAEMRGVRKLDQTDFMISEPGQRNRFFTSRSGSCEGKKNVGTQYSQFIELEL